jgi:hypothetical protein
MHHWRANSDSRHLGLSPALKLASKVRDIGRRPAHIEGNNTLEAGLEPNLCRADNSARRPG